MNTKIIFAAIAGAAAGVTIGMYLGSEEGSEARAALKSAIDEIGKQFSGVLSDSKEKFTEMANDILAGSEELKSQLRSMKPGKGEMG
jgi:hypothetical protein